MKRQNTGQIRIIEAFLAVLIIFSSFAVSANLIVTQNARHSDLASAGLQALMKLDSDGSLSNFVEERNWTALRNALSLVLPSGVSFNLTVYTNQMQQVNTAAISNGGFGSEETVFVEYVCASRGLVFHVYIIHLRLAEAP